MATRKEEIIEISIKLFNEKGCLNTSTRHIADELGISVGNLYYYFKNKEEIIIAIYEEFMNLISKYLIFNDEDNEKAFDFYIFFTAQLKIAIKYKFINQEMLPLYQKFPKVKKVIKNNMEEKYKELKRLYKHQMKHGFMIILNDDELNFLISNTIILRQHGTIYWLLLDIKNEEQEKLSVINFLYFIKPYITQKGLVESKFLESIKYLKKELKHV